MEKFRNGIKKRIYFTVVGIVGFILAIVAVHSLVRPEISDHFAGFQVGMLSGFIAVALFYILRYLLALRDDEKLKKLQIAESDERRLMIYQKSGSVGMNLSIIGLCAAAIICGYFSTTAFVVLMAATLFVSLIRAALKLYYMRKY